MANRTQQVLDQLAQYESRNVTYMDPDGTWPIVWDRAKGVNVWDVEGRKYLDLTAAFGVAAAGHANPAVVRAGQKQMGRLLHAMGDVHPHALKAEIAQELSRLTFERWFKGRVRGKTLFGSSGFEAVEAALKTARLATGRKHVIAFRGGYHGLGYGALNATHREHFREPFRNQLGGFGLFAGFPTDAQLLKESKRELGELFRKQKVGAVLVEPIQARGGINVPPSGFLAMLRKLCDQHGALLVFDEIYTGFGRTGKWFACEHENVTPDLICLGKALTGGFPLSACVGRADVMDAAWPKSEGEAIHTSTFLGHPVGCAMALAQLAEIKKRKLPAASLKAGKTLLRQLNKLSAPSGFTLTARGVGLMVGLEICKAEGSPATHESLEIVKRLLHRGFIILPEGEHANVIGFTPPLTISETQLTRSVQVLARSMKEICSS
jgi:4-aminobutyrate aminotransferase-like enzyme